MSAVKKLAIKYSFLICVLFFSVCILTGCNNKSRDNSDRFTIVATLFPQYDFTRQIAGEYADVIMLLPPGVESHSYDLRPSDMITIKESDMFIYTGKYMETWAESIIESLDEGIIVVDVSEGIELVKGTHDHDEDGECIELHDHEEAEECTLNHNHEEAEECTLNHNHAEAEECTLNHNHEEAEECTLNHNHEEAEECTLNHNHEEAEECTQNHNHAEAEECTQNHNHTEEETCTENHNYIEVTVSHAGHNHEYDPHIWTSPVNAIHMVENITEALCEAMPEHADEFRVNADNYIDKLINIDADFRAVTDNCNNKTIYFGGKFAMTYFAREYGLEVVAAYHDCSAESEPSISSVMNLIDEFRENEAVAVYYEELTDPKVARTISEETEAKLLLLHSAHNVTRDEFEKNITYIDIMEQNVQRLKEGLN